jgi:phosphohistidine phosphatase
VRPGRESLSSVIIDFVRHGEAVPAGSGSDRDRILSAAGSAALHRLRRHLLGAGWSPGQAFSSPYRRAIDSAAILLQDQASAISLGTLGELTPETDPGEALHALASRAAPGGWLLVVSHQPLLGRVVERLTGLSQPLSPGTLVRIECDDRLSPGSGRILVSLREPAS